VASDPTAFGALYERHAPRVRRFLLFLSGGDEALADELTSETFVRAWTAFGRIRQDTVKAYLFAIARNLLHDARRRSARHAPMTDDIADEGISIHRELEDRSELNALLTAMQRLSEEDRAALLMRADQLSYADIAATLKLSVSNAKVRVHRARLKLQRWTASANAQIGEKS
jgi:RNA polymerase sigma-70 factor, ECF subfamily